MKTQSIFAVAVVAAISMGSLHKANAQTDWKLTGNAGTNPPTNFIGTTDNKGLLFKTQGNPRMWIGQGGNVGIGTTEPKANLHIFRGSSGTVTPNANSPLIIENSTNNYISLLAPSTSEKGIIFGDNVNPVNGAILYNSSSSMLFQTKKITRMVLTETGNLGIGNTSPAAKLHISGGSDAGLSGGFIITGDLASDNMGIDNNEIQTRTGGVASTLFLNNDGGDINLRSDAMHITNGKLVGIGIASPTNKLHVVGTTLLNGHVSVGSEQPDATWDLKIGTTTNNGFLMGTAETLEDFGGTTFGSNSNIVPTSDNVRSLGSSTNRWHDIWSADGTINTSDARDKKNIRDLDYGLSKVMQLHPVKFNWKSGINTSDKIGLIAQEIQKVLPDVVIDYDIKTDEATGRQEKVPSARLGVIYTDLIPVLIKSIQELQEQITDLKKQINTSQSASDISEANSTNFKFANATASLEQNTPNPFNSSTVIRYNIPASVSNAQIMVTNASGNMIKRFTLNNKGAGSVTIKPGELAAGSYYYTLITDGKKADSKQMILNK
jgi:hypothetical protein